MRESKLHIDFETRSTLDLTKVGAHLYASHPSTEALCMSWAVNDGPVNLWKLGEKLPATISAATKNLNVIFIAHNASFEFLIWNLVCVKKYGWPVLKFDRFDCTMVRAYSMGLPGRLELAAKAVGMPYEKDMKGHRIMLQLCKPRIEHPDGSFTWWDIKDSTPKLDIKAKYESLYQYCKTDIIVERELDKRVLPLSASERRVFLLDQKINFRGIYVDEVSANKAVTVIQSEQKKFNTAMKDMTDGKVNTCNSSIALRQWINLQGIDCDSVAKADVLDLLEKSTLPEKVRSVLLLRQEASKSSTSKIKAMITSKCPDSRVRGCFQYYGAHSTGRWAGRRIQLHNLKRPLISQYEIEQIMYRLGNANDQEVKDYLNIFHASVIKPISSCIRAMLLASPGKKLIAIDFSAIEGRVLAWLAGEEKTLNIYRSHGKIYEYRACQIYGIDNVDNITDHQRLIGKVSELALGFQGGVGAFQSIARTYFVKVSDTKANGIKESWRRANPNIVNYWYALQNAAIAAVQNPGQRFACGPKNRHITFLKQGSFLFCRLPSSRVICYPYPKMRPASTPWGEIRNALNYKGMIYNKFVTRVAYGGLIAENVTQATARDLLVEAMFRFEKSGYPVITHCHDELVAEVDENYGSVDEAKKLMCILPEWATGLPLKAKGWSGERYRK